MRTLPRLLLLSVLLTLFVLFVDPGTARACTAQSVPLADAIQSSDALIVGEFVSSAIARPRYRGRTALVSIRVRVKRVVAGSAQLNAMRQLSYSEPMPLPRRGGRTLCPMWVGSGIEFNLKKGQSYYLLLSQGRLIRAVKAFRVKTLLSLWTARHWSYVSPAKAKRAHVVMRVFRPRWLGGSKYHWTRVTPLRIYKNISGQKFGKTLRVAQSNRSLALKPGTYTIYLEPYSTANSKHWKLLDGRSSAGTSHYQIPAKKRTPSP